MHRAPALAAVCIGVFCHLAHRMIAVSPLETPAAGKINATPKACIVDHVDSPGYV